MRLVLQQPVNAHRGGAYDPRLTDHDYQQAAMLAALFADSGDDYGFLKDDPCPVNRLTHKLLTGDMTTMYKPLDVSTYREQLQVIEDQIEQLQVVLAGSKAANDDQLEAA